MGVCFGRRKPLGKPRGRWEGAVWDTIGLLQIRTWKAAVGKREGLKKEIGEAMARKWAEAP
jgi:hypothetical protein